MLKPKLKSAAVDTPSPLQATLDAVRAAFVSLSAEVGDLAPAARKAAESTTATSADLSALLAKEKREGEKPAQVGPVSGGRGNTGGDRLAARDLGITQRWYRPPAQIRARRAA